MDQIKIGKFIADCRKKQNLTQMQLAEKLNVTDRAVSKWERGKAMPDSSIMLELCALLKITVNELLSGEEIDMENYNKELEKNLLEAVKQKEQADKRLLRLEVVIGVICVLVLLAACIVAVCVELEEWKRILIVIAGLVPLIIALPFMLKIEQVAGYYECKECGHRYVPTLKQINLSMHMGRTRYMKCPNCGKKSWQKKVISKEK
jgi:transcriptional regulator with XRE-family HTH domain/DNA-directed RNA polymerase subunit RPC12/RpoP